MAKLFHCLVRIFGLFENIVNFILLLHETPILLWYMYKPFLLRIAFVWCVGAVCSPWQSQNFVFSRLSSCYFWLSSCLPVFFFLFFITPARRFVLCSNPLRLNSPSPSCSRHRHPAHTHQVIEAKGRPKRNAVVVTELPYQVNKSALLQRMAEMVNDKKVGPENDVGCDTRQSIRPIHQSVPKYRDRLDTI